MDAPEQETIIAELYELVSAPETYDEFMLSLHGKLAAMRAGAQAEQASFITSHMKRAAALVDIVTPWRRDVDEDLHREMVQRMQATLALDEFGHILDANTSAKVAYDLAPGATLKQLPITPEALQLLRARLRQMIGGAGGANATNDVMRFQNTGNARPFLVRLERHVQASTGRVLVLLRTGDVGWPSHLGPILQDLFDLTRAEVAVVRLMVEGAKPKEIAARRSASVTTVRSQLQSIFAKTDTRDQMDCIRMVFGLSLMHDADEGELVATRIEAAKQTAFFPREDQRHLFRPPGGPQLEYSDFGDPKGRVVLFNHDQAFGDVWFKEAHDLARRLGLRIVGPLRPGFGQTTIYDGPASEPRAFAPQVRALLDHLGIEQVTILALSSGLVHSLAAAELMPDRVQAITACHPLLPVVEDADLDGTNGYNHLIPHARLHFPASLPFLCKAGFAFVMRSGPAAFGKAVMRASARDVEWIMRPDILPVMVHGRRVHRDQGHVGNLGDLNYRVDWRDRLRSCKVPIRLVIGENDRNVQWGAARRWAKACDHIDLRVLSDAGYMVHHQRPETILGWLRQDLEQAQRA